MILGMSTSAFTLFHVVGSLIAIVTGIILCLAAVDHLQMKEVTAMGDSAREMARAIVHFR